MATTTVSIITVGGTAFKDEQFAGVITVELVKRKLEAALESPSIDVFFRVSGDQASRLDGKLMTAEIARREGTVLFSTDTLNNGDCLIAVGKPLGIGDVGSPAAATAGRTIELRPASADPARVLQQLMQAKAPAAARALQRLMQANAPAAARALQQLMQAKAPLPVEVVPGFALHREEEVPDMGSDFPFVRIDGEYFVFRSWAAAAIFSGEPLTGAGEGQDAEATLLGASTFLLPTVLDDSTAEAVHKSVVTFKGQCIMLQLPVPEGLEVVPDKVECGASYEVDGRTETIPVAFRASIVPATEPMLFREYFDLILNWMGRAARCEIKADSDWYGSGDDDDDDGDYQDDSRHGDFSNHVSFGGSFE